MNAREEILARVRAALRDVPHDEAPEAFPVPRDYLPAHAGDDPQSLADLLAGNLAEYRARVHRAAEEDLPQLIESLLARQGSTSVAVPRDLPASWLSRCADLRLVHDSPALGARDLDRVGSAVTGCAVAVAETGTVVLDAGPGQGRRILSLVPDHHVCVVRVPDQVVASVSGALRRLNPRRPLTWISGPSATSDIEFSRVEGVHGPRTLDVVLLAG